MGLEGFYCCALGEYSPLPYLKAEAVVRVEPLYGFSALIGY
jgi:hypothetical protein